jgi:hypothetical protein
MPFKLSFELNVLLVILYNFMTSSRNNQNLNWHSFYFSLKL